MDDFGLFMGYTGRSSYRHILCVLAKSWILAAMTPGVLIMKNKTLCHETLTATTSKLSTNLRMTQNF